MTFFLQILQIITNADCHLELTILSGLHEKTFNFYGIKYHYDGC